MGAYLDAFVGSLFTIFPFDTAGMEAFTLLLLGVLIGAIAGHRVRAARRKLGIIARGRQHGARDLESRKIANKSQTATHKQL